MADIKENLQGQYVQIAPKQINKISTLQDLLNRELPEHAKRVSKNKLYGEALDLLFKKYKI